MAQVIRDNRDFVETNDRDNTVVVREGDDMSVTGLLARIVYFVSSVIIGLLLIRFFFVLFGANAANGFVDFIYTLTRPLVAPFFGIFNYSPTYVNGRFEYETLIAIAVYALVAWLLLVLLGMGRGRSTTI